MCELVFDARSARSCIDVFSRRGKTYLGRVVVGVKNISHLASRSIFCYRHCCGLTIIIPLVLARYPQTAFPPRISIMKFHIAIFASVVACAAAQDGRTIKERMMEVRQAQFIQPSVRTWPYSTMQSRQEFWTNFQTLMFASS